MTDGPLAAYRALCRTEGFSGDPVQELAAEKLQSLHHALQGYEPSGGGWAERFGLARRADPPQGLYIFGPVGRGKSMLMDMFFERAPVERKRRVHFHEFMLDVQARLHRLRKADKAGGKDGLIDALAGEMAGEAWLLCFDEFQVTDIADAMILGRLFEALFAAGVVVLATSNTGPAELYAGGLQRELFLPFIALIEARLDLLHLDGGTDYRLARVAGRPVYHTPLGKKASAALDRAFLDLTDTKRGEPVSLELKGRTLKVPQAARGVARFTFAELCEGAHGAADYLALAENFHTLVLDGIPRMSREQRNEAHRFSTLIDALYEVRIRLICSGEAPPDALYVAGTHSKAFRRTASRLIEMQSADYPKPR
ncbi:MAG: cell division protein ZapE [Alphaproteobacteria bacterium]